MRKGSEWGEVRLRTYRCGLRRLRLLVVMLHDYRPDVGSAKLLWCVR